METERQKEPKSETTRMQSGRLQEKGKDENNDISTLFSTVESGLEEFIQGDRQPDPAYFFSMNRT